MVWKLLLMLLYTICALKSFVFGNYIPKNNYNIGILDGLRCTN